ncbi:Aste57867_12723 [Aphanomyces stellatus]|uniref:Aste57867_12723 protein n=1 Tax=Aphanomyces stellatus TaxID=120398 RepID=A0A485KWB2_9STRA|nr:hypothetical protein As57867_012675 [Aphanomyces stellatus]VFT89573.1 Aste57867_12723 [Aphanomyces stellatus]
MHFHFRIQTSKSPPMSAEEVTVGDLEKICLLGKGGVGRVYLSRDKRTGHEYALKEVVLNSASRIERLDAEKGALGPLLHRAFEDGDTTSLLMTFLPGDPLYQSLWQRGHFSEAIAKNCAAQVVASLLDLHARGYMHRDVKSGNILLNSLDGRCHLVDFGFAKQHAHCERAMSLCGTYYVMAPEVFRRRGYGRAVDWWAVGVLIYEMVRGMPPWPYKCNDGDMVRYFQRLEEPVDFSAPCFANPILRALLEGLLQPDPTARLTGVDVKHHAWFEGFDWENPKVDMAAEELRKMPSTANAIDSAESVTSAENALFAGF